MFKNNKAFSSFSVNDMQKAKEFYGQKLGLEVSEIPEMQGMLELKISDNNKIFIYSKSNHKPATFTILNFPVGNIDKAVDDLNKLGITCEQYDFGEYKTDAKGIMRGKPNVAWFRDPAGNILSVVEGD